MSRYNVVSFDNGAPGASTHSMKRGDFEDADSAIARARQLVDAALDEHLPNSKDAHELMAHYGRDGSEVPQIFGEPRAAFHAYQYARERANALFAEKADPLPAR